MNIAMQNSYEREKHETQRNCLFWWTWLDFYTRLSRLVISSCLVLRGKNLEEKSLCQEKKSCNIVYKSLYNTISLQLYNIISDCRKTIKFYITHMERYIKNRNWRKKMHNGNTLKC